MLHQRKWQTNTPCWRSGRIADGDIFHPDLPMVFWGGRPTVFGDPSAKSTRQWSWKPWCCATSFHILTLQCLWKPMGLSLRLVVQTHLETRERMKWHVKSKLVGPGKKPLSLWPVGYRIYRTQPQWWQQERLLNAQLNAWNLSCKICEINWAELRSLPFW